MKIDLLKIAALTDAATKGPWFLATYSGEIMPWVCDDTGVEIARTSLIRAVDDDHIANASYITAVSPDVVKELIRQVVVMRGALKYYASHGKGRHDCPTCDSGDMAEEALADVEEAK